MSPAFAAVVLAGGEGRRMDGRDKAQLDVGGRTMIDRVLSALVGAGARELVVVGPRRLVETKGVLFTVEDEAGGGPVPAIAAGLAQVGAAEAVVLLSPVDVPLLRSVDVVRLLDALEQEPDVDVAAAAGHQGRPNALLAAYRRHALVSSIDTLGDSAGAAAYKLLENLTSVVVDIGSTALNVNTPEDLDAARRGARTLPDLS